MKTYKLLLFICLAQVFLSGCSKKSPSIEDDFLRVKVHNLSSYTLKEITIFSISIEDLHPRASSSEYKFTFERKKDEPFKSYMSLKTGDGDFFVHLFRSELVFKHPEEWFTTTNINNVYVECEC